MILEDVLIPNSKRSNIVEIVLQYVVKLIILVL